MVYVHMSVLLELDSVAGCRLILRETPWQSISLRGSYKTLAAQYRTSVAMASNEDSDQPGQPPCLSSDPWPSIGTEAIL